MNSRNCNKILRSFSQKLQKPIRDNIDHPISEHDYQHCARRFSLTQDKCSPGQKVIVEAADLLTYAKYLKQEGEYIKGRLAGFDSWTLDLMKFLELVCKKAKSLEQSYLESAKYLKSKIQARDRVIARLKKKSLTQYRNLKKDTEY